MNLLIENLNSALLNKIDANVIKTLQGEFAKEDLNNEISNLYFSKVIIDITAIKDYTDFNTLFDFLSYFEKDRVILLLDDSVSKECISKLVQEGYYDFTKNVGGINYLASHPNTLKDVEKYILPNEFNPLNNNLNIINKPVETKENLPNNNQVIIGIQNLTPHAGATTLMYMMVKMLKTKYNVMGIELAHQDYIFFRDPNITIAITLEELKQKIKNSKDKEIIIVDLNGLLDQNICNDILYLIEPGVINLNRLFKDINNKNLSNGKIVLNRSSIKDSDIPSFEYETKMKVFANLPNLNERANNINEIIDLLIKLGFNKLQNNKGFWNLFR